MVERYLWIIGKLSVHKKRGGNVRREVGHKWTGDLTEAKEGRLREGRLESRMKSNTIINGVIPNIN